MKKIFGMFMFAFLMFVNTGLNAQNVTQTGNDDENKERQYYAVEVSDLNPEVNTAINNAYQNCRIDEVYVSNAGKIIKYKVVLLTQDRQKLKVYLNAKGEVINEYKTF